jgi:protein-tyrosine phosphatase
MIKTVLVVCVGNICRSPLGERLLKLHAPHLDVSSAGIGALVGKPADDTASQIAAAQGVSLDGHVARQFSADLGKSADLILVMEAGHKAQIGRETPQLSGKTMLFDHWVGAAGVPDPYRKSQDYHKIVFDQVEKAAKAWAEKLKIKGSA